MDASLKAAYGRDGFYIHDAAMWPLDAIDRAVEGMDAVRRGEYDTGVPPRPSAWQPGDDPQRLCKAEFGRSHVYRTISPGARQARGPDGLYRRPDALPDSLQSQFLIPILAGGGQC